MVVATGIYTIFGGLAAVIYTELLQAVVLLAGAIALTVHRACRSRRNGRPAQRRCRPTSFT